MTRIYSYLTFSGNCREAMTFYRYCFGGELHFQTIGESPMSQKMPRRMKACILHAALLKEGVILLTATDCVPETGLQKGNAVALSLNCSSEEEIRNYYQKLTEGGKAEQPLKHSFWGAWVGGVRDRFGNHWLLHYDAAS